MKQKLLLISIILVVIGLGYFVLSPDALVSLVDQKQALSQALAETESKIPTQTGKNLFLKQSNNLTIKVDPELTDLDSQIISCDSNVDNLMSTGNIGGSCVGGGTTLSNVKGKFLGGQCCGGMKDTTAYHAQLQKLQAYKSIPDIPLNPYKTPVELAKKWIDYDKSANLTEDQQKIFNQALSMSKEGPCCCKCWHYYVNEGIAKKMIQDKGWTGQQVAQFWDNSSIC